MYGAWKNVIQNPALNACAVFLAGFSARDRRGLAGLAGVETENDFHSVYSQNENPPRHKRCPGPSFA
jgi:hypothetical protein